MEIERKRWDERSCKDGGCRRRYQEKVVVDLIRNLAF